jgi:hypothetical protein
MLRKNIVGLLICIAAMGVTTLGFAGIPELSLSTATMLNAPAGVNLNIYNTPDGSGYAMTEARRLTTTPGTWEDATITVTLLDAGSSPVFSYPFEDIWLENPPAVPPPDPNINDPTGLLACPNGAVADASTDINGVTTFSGPFFAGGFVDYTNDANDANDGKTYVMVSGLPITSAGSALNLLFNSADINGDGQWDSAADVILFSAKYPPITGYFYSVDYYFDGVNDISDLVLFSAAQFVVCP